MRALLLLLLVATLTACGFQLRRELVLPVELSHIRIVAANPDDGLVDDLSAALRRSGAVLAAPDAAATSFARLRIPRASLSQRPLSVGAGGRVQEFALVYLVEIELIDAKGVVRVPNQTVELQRVYSFDAAAAFGTPGEAEIVRDELARDMVAALLRRIEAALRAGGG
jgi:LPS-assembly lipoprotein